MSKRREINSAATIETDPFEEAIGREEVADNPLVGSNGEPPARPAPAGPRRRQVTLPTFAEIDADLATLEAERKRLRAVRKLLEKLDGQGLLPVVDPDEVAADL